MHIIQSLTVCALPLKLVVDLERVIDCDWNARKCIHGNARPAYGLKRHTMVQCTGLSARQRVKSVTVSPHHFLKAAPCGGRCESSMHHCAAWHISCMIVHWSRSESSTTFVDSWIEHVRSLVTRFNCGGDKMRRCETVSGGVNTSGTV